MKKGGGAVPWGRLMCLAICALGSKVGAAHATPINVSNDAAASLSPEIATDGQGNVCVAWRSETGEILRARSSDGGRTFSTPLNVSRAPMTGRLLVASADCDIHVLRTVEREVYFARAANGVTFSPEVNLSNSPSNSSSADNAVDSQGRIFVLWYEHIVPLDFMELWFRRSTDGGTTFSAPMLLDRSRPFGGNLVGARLLPDASGVLHVQWDRQGRDPRLTSSVVYARSTDAGVTFQTQSLASGIIFGSPDQGTAVSARHLAADGSGNVVVVFRVRELRAGPNPPPVVVTEDFRSRRSEDGGASFFPEEILDPSTGVSSATTIASGAAGKFWLAGPSTAPGATGILVSRSLDAAASFEPAVLLPATDASSPRILYLAPSTVVVQFIATSQATQSSDVFQAISLDNGRTFSAPINLSGSTTPTHSQVAAVAGVGAVTSCWVEQLSNTNSDVYCRTTRTPDVTPPVIHEATASPSVLWPPNHELVDVVVRVTVTDDRDLAPTCAIVAASSDEPDSGIDRWDLSGDLQITGPLTASLRAERGGAGDGRRYELTVSCRDAAGNTAATIVTVSVPHDRRK